jgi:two-component system capsular synthesis sensor histidine kinase RcsC
MPPRRDSDDPTLLVVDDDPLIVRAMIRMLASYHQPVVALTAHNGEDALALLADHHVDVLLSDLFMPGIDGFALMEQARARQPHLTLVAITAERTKQTMARCQELGVSGFVTKPLDTRELHQHLDLVLAIARKRGGYDESLG